MPTNFSIIAGISLKKFKLSFLLILSPFLLDAQTLTGLWIGALSNDSNTVRKDQSFEIALTEYKGKVYGYSRSEFIVDEILYYVVKRVKGTIQGDICEVKDDEIIAFNFPGKLDKGVKLTSIFRRNRTDSSWYLDGTWKTNQTKNYYTVTGKVSLQEEKDLGSSKIFPHLEELNLATEVAFYKERKEGPPIVRIAKPEKINLGITARREEFSVRTDEVAIAKPNLTKTEPVENAVTMATPIEKDPVDNDPVAVVKPLTKNNSLDPTFTDINTKGSNGTIVPSSTSAPINNKKPLAAINSDKKEPVAVQANDQESLAIKKQEQEKIKNADNKELITGEDIPTIYPSIAQTNKEHPVKAPNPPQNTSKSVPASSKPIEKNTVKTTVPSNKEKINPVAKQPGIDPAVVISVPVIVPNKSIESNENWNEPVILPVIKPVRTSIAERNGAAVSINERKTEVSQVVNFKSDSLLLALYDNGQVDGDTVSVLMNGEVILAKQGLKASAIRKTIYLTPGTNNEFTLVLYAENLGAYPPNTGLLVVHDGEDVYNLRFSSDFQKNSGIVFRRKN